MTTGHAACGARGAAAEGGLGESLALRILEENDRRSSCGLDMRSSIIASAAADAFSNAGGGAGAASSQEQVDDCNDA